MNDDHSMGTELRLVTKLQLKHIARAEADETMEAPTSEMERVHDIKFSSLTVLDKPTLDELEDDPEAVRNSQAVRILSDSDEHMKILVDELTEIANCGQPRRYRHHYLSNVLKIFQSMNVPMELLQQKDTVVVAPEREGAYLAQELDWLPEARHCRPNAKRIHWKDGLLLGLEGLGSEFSDYTCCVIVDGAVASGSTIVAVLDRLSDDIDHFRVYTAHATEQGLRAILRIAESHGVSVEIVAGHVSGTLDDHYYAVLDDGRQVVGDLGDTLC